MVPSDEKGAKRFPGGTGWSLPAGLPVSLQVAVVWFGNSARLEFDLDDLPDKVTLLDGIDNIRFSAGTCNHQRALCWIVKALRVGSRMLSKSACKLERRKCAS